MGGKKISVQMIVRDVSDGLDASSLMLRHSLSEIQLKQVLQKLVNKGHLKATEVEGILGSFTPPGFRNDGAKVSKNQELTSSQQEADRNRLPVQPTNPVLYKLERIEPEFPENVWTIRSYKNPFRIFVLAIVLVNLYGLTSAYVFADYQKARNEAKEEIKNRGGLKKAYYWFKGKVWQTVPEEKQAEDGAKDKIESQRRWAWFWLLGSLGLLWIAFDWDRAMAYVTSALLGGLMIGYFLSPIDFIPDSIPIAGTADDLGVVGGGLGLILVILKRYHQQRATLDHVRTLEVDSPKLLADGILRNHGYRISTVGKQGEQET